MAFPPRLSPRDSVVDFRIDFGIQPLQMELITVKIEKPAAINFVLGQTHFIKTVEDIHETLVAAVPVFSSAWHSARLRVNAWSAGVAPMRS